jgi:glycosyltransferase involved in cell wall biosynthesis
MNKKILLCMTSDFKYDQRMQKISSVFETYGDVVILHRSQEKFLTNDRCINIKCLFKTGFLFYLEFNIRILFCILNNKFDIIYGADTDTLLGIGMAKVFKNFVGFYDSHELFTEVPELEGKTIKKFIWLQIEYIFVAKMDYCITVNESISFILESQHKRKFTVVRNVPVKLNDPSKVLKENTIIYQGALNKGRGIEACILAMKFVEGYKLKIYGDGDLKNKLQDLTKKNMLSNKIEFMGKLLPNVLINETKKAKLGLNLLDDVSKNYFFSSANKFFDYIHARVPSLNMEFPEYMNMIKQHNVGDMILNLNVEKLADKINFMLQEESQLVYEHHFDKAIEEYNWNKEKTNLKILIEEKFSII